ncbi:MAG: CxxC motif-containing protein (DUF1111 family) [Planctomycetota bacterium]|jgi:CxxC motif-containing protein (DUF1111 family)
MALAASVFLSAVALAQSDFQRRQGEPMAGLTPSELALFLEGKQAFNTPLGVANGVGPIFNDQSCGNCHSQPAIGGWSSRTVTRFGKKATQTTPFDGLDSLGGTLQQEQEISPECAEIVPPEADITAQRLTPIVFGSGLLEAISDADILLNQASQPAGFVGFAHMVQPIESPMGPLRASKFNWKGGTATVLNFSADAGLNELGLTSVFFPMENAPNGDLAQLALCDTVADPEDLPDVNGRTLVDKFTSFQRYLAAPPQTPRSGTSGEARFTAIGCAVCHTATPYTTVPVAELALSGIAVKPYSDFLVHEMGTMGDGFVEGAAAETEMMTRALWGIGSRTSMLHDGTATGGTFADNITMAIVAHDGEGLASAVAFQALTTAERGEVFDFLSSLGRAEWDFENDNDVDEFDWFFVQPDLSGPLPSFGPDAPGALSDVDEDGDFDLADFAVMQRAFTGNL